MCIRDSAEALECAMKTARRYQHDRGHPERYDILTFQGAFHGRTFATINAGGNPKYVHGFGQNYQVSSAYHSVIMTV